MATFELFISFVTLLCIATVFSNRNRLAIGTLLGGVCLLGPLAIRKITELIEPSNSSSAIVNYYGFTIALVLSTLMVLLVFYSIGYRLSQSRGRVG